MSVIPIRTRVRTDETWDQPEAFPLALGCPTCPDFDICGGLHTADSSFNCRDRCDCEDPRKCPSVCRLSIERFSLRHREIGGFDLSNVPRAPLVPLPAFPTVVPLIYHGSNRTELLNEQYIAVPLHRLYRKRDGLLTFESKEALCASLRIRPNAFIVASGVGQDNEIEPFWRLSSSSFLAGLARIGVDAFTTPNFSLSSDAPRQDNLHAMKRIALVWSAMANAGLPTALHLNARTDADYERWGSWIRQRPEVTSVAFEFGTGAGSANRIDYHIGHLSKLAMAAGRPLTIIIRGGSRRLATLRSHFESVVVLDTTPFPKTFKRRRAVISQSDRLVWQNAYATFAKGKALDELLAHNIELSRRSILEPALPRSHSRLPTGRRQTAQHADTESRQSSFGTGFEPPRLDKPSVA
jgi:hypothetical protein